MHRNGAHWMLVWAWLWIPHVTATPLTGSFQRRLHLLQPRHGPGVSVAYQEHRATPVTLTSLGAHAPRGHARNPLVRDHFLIKWRKIAENHSLHPVNFTAFKVIREKEAKTFHVHVSVTNNSLQIFRDHIQVYHKDGSPTSLNYLPHAGVHVVVMHPQRGDVMLARQFLTHQPSEHRNLASCLASLSPGRIVVVVAVPEAVVFLGQDAIRELEVIGASRIRHLAYDEAWALISHTPFRSLSDIEHLTNTTTANNNNNSEQKEQEIFRHSPSKHYKGSHVGEAASIIRRPGKKAGPLILLARVPKTPSVWCSWHEDTAMEEQRRFCDTYEGYARLCTCNDPVTREMRYSAPRIEMKESIPVAMLTAVKPFHFYRQLLNLLETPGAAQTPILVMVDGPREETVRLTELFGLDVLVHSPQGAAGSTTLLNMHFRFSVHNVFNFFPDVDKAIILEDDLILSPDFISFFHQTAWLLDADPTIFCVNAFSVNSYPTVAGDPHVLRRLEMFPQFGWMINRRWAREQFAYWIPEEQGGDWDWWLSSQNSLQGRHALVPEVGRTFHSGAAGAHVTGWFQEHLFTPMIYNLDPDVKLLGLEDLVLDRYKAKMERDILNATDLVLGEDFCATSDSILPTHQPGNFRMFVRSMSKSDEYMSFYMMHLCLHAFTEDTREKFEGVVRFNLQGRLLFIIGCPMSPYCRLFPKGQNIVNPSPGIVKLAEDRSFRWQTKNYPASFPIRALMPRNPLREFLMQNIAYNYFNGTVQQYDET
ncbi:LOW QUALITY PROTEIN: protein O-linked-mannose beta-1,2-N-acetylglucosaminyltransferase 1-like [Portunus trituberculatus]|uniref:LOW QUALITY PROTEIN: protein O-linked-mannose beta-1,2-N-acetylglucosaminyltransferase 1-like n=1 Tax=Portunus trituberculatus TaxID=210409 RepID=UPI001E1CFA34|nr:LOW QUALITY PROTEIN: protein O-linked-mannose beta-1,2-N-acetylglucosaminyltransferase 1-like [Portunus trituberculatus]